MSDTVKGLLVQLTSVYNQQLAMLKQVTQRQVVAGVIAYEHGQSYTPTLDDMRLQLVNDDPNHRLPDGFGAKVDNLFYEQGNLLIRVIRTQKAEGVVPNTGAELQHAWQTGDYSAIRGA